LSWHREFAGDMAGLVEACSWIEELSSANSLGDDVANALQVCFEELASNIVRHSGDGVWSDPPVLASPKSTSLVFKVDLSIEPDRVRLGLQDNGKPFDVVSAQSHGVDQPLENMAVGGLGLHLVKTLSSAVSYRRTEFGNEVELEFSRVPLQEPGRL
jgi:anti-sigma regulatory factor (Ser/Thr protein kinase)